MKNIILFLLSILFFGCNTEKEKIKSGTFELYENDSIVGTIYRIEDYQIEKYFDSSELLIARIEYLNDSTYLINGIEETQIGVDSIIWLTSFKKISKNKYKITAKPNNANIDYTYRATLLKIADTVPKTYRNKLESLNQK